MPIHTDTYTSGDDWLIALLCSVAAIGAALWYHVRVSRAADNVPDFAVEFPPEPEPHAEPHVPHQAVFHAQAEPFAELRAEAHTQHQAESRKLNWMSDSDNELVEYVAANRGVDNDWRHLHEAAKAGRIVVVSRLHHELHISALLTNKRGRSILQAAIDHRRHSFIAWLAHWPYDVDPKPPAYEQQTILFSKPDATGRKPFLAAATRRDLGCVRAMLSSPFEHILPGRSERCRLGPPSTDREEFLAVCTLLADDDSNTPALLMRELRRFDVCWRLRFRLDKDFEKERACCEQAPWWPPNLEVEPWTAEEARSLYLLLLQSVRARRVDCAAWILDALHVSPSPPAGTRWQGQHLGDYAVICDALRSLDVDELEQTEGQKDEAAKEHQFSWDARQAFYRDREYVLSKWDGRSSMSLVEQTEAWLAQISKHLGASEKSRFKHQHEELVHWAMHAAGGTLPADSSSFWRELMGAGAAGVGSDGSTAMLQMLTDRLGVKGAPRLHVIVLTGSAWALRWLLDSNLVALDTPLGGTQGRLPSLEEGGEDNCTICLDGILSPVRLPCGHSVCRACIRNWFAHVNGQARCPTCTTNVVAPDNVLPQNLTFALSDDLARHAPWLPGAQPPNYWSTSSKPLGHALAALAAYRGALSVLELLRDAGVDLCLTFEGNNLMHFACMNRQSHIVRWLVEEGHARLAIDISHEDKRALHYACESGDDSTIGFLRHLPSHMVRREAHAVEAAESEIESLEFCIRYELKSQKKSDEAQVSEMAAAGITVSVEQLEEVRAESLAGRRAELEAARRRVEGARTDLAAAKQQFTWLAAAAEGWVAAAIASPFANVSNDAKRYQAAAAAEEALTVTLPQLLADGAPLSAFLELQSHLENSRIGRAADYRAPPRDSNPWLKVVRDITEHGRADVLRWMYSERRSLLSHVYGYNRKIDDDFDLDPELASGETYESFGRQLATQCTACCDFTQLYDDLRASDAAFRAWRDAIDGLDQAFGFTEDSRPKQAPGFTEPVLPDVLHAVAQIDAAFAMYPDDMRPDYIRSGAEVFDPPIASLKENGSGELLGGYTYRNFAAIRGYLNLVRWFVEERPVVPGRDIVEEVLRMVYLIVSNLPYPTEIRGAHTIETLEYLLHWLLARDSGLQLIAHARFGCFGGSDHNDHYSEYMKGSVTAAPDPNRSLLDVAVHNVAYLVPSYHAEKEEPLATCLERCWDCVNLLQAHVPACELTCFNECMRHMGWCRNDGMEWWSEREGNALRFLLLAESKGVDLAGSVTSRRDEHISIAQALANSGWINCVRWLAEERGIDVQNLTVDRYTSMLCVNDERLAQMKADLTRVQRAQRQRHEAARQRRV